jgi:hypothetical protein
MSSSSPLRRVLSATLLVASLSALPSTVEARAVTVGASTSWGGYGQRSVTSGPRTGQEWTPTVSINLDWAPVLRGESAPSLISSFA